MLGGMAIGWGVSKLLEGVGWLYKQISGKAAEEAKQKIIETGEAANSKITEIQQKLDKLNTSVKSASESYTKLMDGIEKSSNANISLSSEDYDEFISSSNELAEMFPELVIGLDNEENKILALGNNAEEATNKLNDLIEAQKIVLANETKDNLKDSFKGLYTENENQRNEIAKYNDLKSQIDPDFLISDLLGASGNSISLQESAFPDIDAQLLMNNVAKVINDALGTEIKPEYLDLTGEWFIPLSELSEEQINKALESVKINKDYLYTTITDYIDNSINKVENDINSDYQNKLVEIFTALSGEDIYNQLDVDSKSIVNSIISSLNYSSVQDVVDKDYGGSIVEYIKKQIIDEFNNAQNDPNISKALSEVFTNTKLTPDEKLNYIKQIQGYFGEDNIITISLQPQLEDTELLQKQYNDAINRFDGSQDRLAQFFKDNSINDSSKIEFWNQTTKGAKDAEEAIKMYNKAFAEATNNKLSSFDQLLSSPALKSTRDKLIELSQLGIISEENISGLEGYNELLAECGGKVDDLIKKIEEYANKSGTAFGTINSLDTVKGGLDTLSKTYADKMDGDGFVQSDLLSSLYEQFGDLSFFDDFINKMMDVNSTTQETQEAFDKLATQFIDTKYNIADLTNENAKYVAEDLKKLGVINAEQAVQDRLNFVEAQRNQILQDLSSNEKTSALAKKYHLDTTNDLVKATDSELIALAQEIESAGLSASSIRALALQKQGVNSVTIDTTTDVGQLLEMAQAAGLSAYSLSILKSVKDGNIKDSSAISSIVSDTKTQIKKLLSDFNIDYSYKFSGNNSSSKGSGSSGSSSSSSTIFDWIERKIKKLTTYIERWSKYIESATDINKLSKYYNKLQSTYSSLGETYSKAATYYYKKANNVKLDSEYKNKVRDGRIALEEIKDSKLAEKINKYQEYWDKYQGYIDSYIETQNKLANVPLDKASDKVEMFSDSITLLDKKLENAIGYRNKNALINEQSKQEKQKLDAYTLASNEAQTNLKNASKFNFGGQSDVSKNELKQIQKAISNSKELDMTFFNVGSKAYKAAVKYNEMLKANEKATYDLSTAQQEYSKWLVTSAKNKFDNVADDYSNKIKILSYDMQTLDNQISNIETAGKNVNKKYYEEQKKNVSQRLDTYNQELKSLEKYISKIKQGTNEWYDAKDSIEECKNSISDCVNETYNLNNAINELRLNMFDDIGNALERIITEQEFLQGLFAHEKTTDDKIGNLTNAGIAKLGSTSASYYVAKLQADNQQALLNELQNVKNFGKLSNGTYSFGEWTFNSLEDLDKEIDKVYTNWQDSIKAVYNQENNIVELMKSKYQAELNMVKELIDKKKENLNLEKDLHDYQKTLREKTDSITTLQKQIAAYQGDTSAEAMAKLQKLQAELNDKQEDLRETEYDRYISDQQDMLDKLYSEYEELITKKLDDFWGLFKEGIEVANEHTELTNKYLNRICTENGYTEETKNLFSNVSTNISEAIKSKSENIIDAIISSSGTGGIDYKPDNTTTGTENTSNNTNNTNNNNNNTNNSNPAKQPTNSTGGMTAIQDKDFVLNQVKNFISKNAKSTTKDKKSLSDVNKAIYDNKSKAYKGKGKVLSGTALKELAKIVGVQYNGLSKNDNLYKKLKSIKLPGFSKGGVVKISDLEKQIKNNGDSVLASLNANERVLTPIQNKLFEDFVGELPNLVKIPDIYKNLPNVLERDKSANIEANYSFNFENCRNVDDLINQLHNPKVQKALRAETTDKLISRNRL